MLPWALAASLASAQAPEPAPGLVAPGFLAPLELAWPAGADPERGEQQVLVELRVGERGEVREVVPRAGEEPFLSAGVAAAKAARLSPATEGGVPVEAWVPLTLRFTPPPRVLEGVVRIAGGGAAPLAGASVRVGGVVVPTDAEGRFALRGLAPGRWRVELDAPGFRVDALDVELRAGEVAQLELWALPEGVDPGIVGSYRRGRAEVGRRSLDAAELRKAPGSLGDPLRAVSNLPGTTRPPLESGWLLVRGGDPTHTAVYVDGARVPLVYHLGGFTSVLHPAFVDRVEFLPGGGGARYGHSLAGTVDVVTRAPAHLPELRAGANLVFAGAYASAPVGRGSVAAAFRRSYLDAVAAPLLPEASAGVLPRFWDWQARADAGPVGVFGFGYADAVDLPTEGALSKLRVGTQRVQARVDLRLGDRPLRLVPSLAWESLVIDAADVGVYAGQERVGGALRVELPDEGEAFLDGSVGLDLDAAATRVRYDEVERRAPAGTPAVYGDLRVGTEAQLVAGLRLDTLLVGGQPARAGLSPRLAGRLPLGSRAGLELEASGRHSAPGWELLLTRPEGASLELDQAWGGSLGGWWGAGPVELTLEAYARHMPVLAQVEADLSVDEGQGLAWGVELAGRARFARASVDARVAVGESLRREDADAAWVPSAYDQPLTLGLAGAVELGRAWSLAGRFRYGSGFPAQSDPQRVVDALTLETVGAPLVDGRVEPFHALDVKLSRRFAFRTWRLDVYLDVQNVYNRRVPEPFITGLADVSVEGMGFGLITLPVFGVEGAWGGDPRRP